MKFENKLFLKGKTVPFNWEKKLIVFKAWNHVWGLSGKLNILFMPMSVVTCFKTLVNFYYYSLSLTRVVLLNYPDILNMISTAPLSGDSPCEDDWCHMAFGQPHSPNHNSKIDSLFLAF